MTTIIRKSDKKASIYVGSEMAGEMRMELMRQGIDIHLFQRTRELMRRHDIDFDTVQKNMNNTFGYSKRNPGAPCLIECMAEREDIVTLARELCDAVTPKGRVLSDDETKTALREEV